MQQLSFFGSEDECLCHIFLFLCFVELDVSKISATHIALVHVFHYACRSVGGAIVCKCLACIGGCTSFVSCKTLCKGHSCECSATPILPMNQVQKKVADVKAVVNE